MFRSSVNTCLLLTTAVLIIYPGLGLSYIGAEWNPTGEPIGGGPCYSDSVRHQDADYYVVTKEQLLVALASATAGDIIYIADSAEIDMGEAEEISVPGGVTLASGRGRILDGMISWGGLIYTNDRDDEMNCMFRTGGNDVRVTGLRLRGPDGEISDRSNTQQYVRSITCLELTKSGAEVDNCEIYDWPRAGIQVTGTFDTAYIHHNYLHHIRRQGSGYGVVCNGNNYSLIEGNYSNFCRHHVAATFDITNSYEARYNIYGYNSYLQGLDRHGSGDDGGKLTWIHHCTDKNNSPTSNVYAVSIRGIPQDSGKIHDCWFWEDDSIDAFQVFYNNNMLIHDIHYGSAPPSGMSSILPVSVANADVDSGTVPLTVLFDGTNSFDNDGTIAWYEWSDGDGNTVRNATMSHTYDEIGIYHAELMVWDNKGCEDKEFITIKVLPDDNSSYISLWVKDGYRGNASGYFSIRVLIDSEVIWQQDVAGDSGWIHVVENIEDEISGKDSVTVALEVRCDQQESGQFVELEVYFDDVAVFGGEMSNGNFEEDGNHWIYQCGGTGFLYDPYYTSEEVRSRNRAALVTQQYNVNATQGAYGRLTQTISMTGIAEQKGSSLKSGKLISPFPNPAMSSTTVAYSLISRSTINVGIYDITGSLVRELISATQDPGQYSILWDGTDTLDRRVSSGVYFCRISAEDWNDTKQIIWVR
ncbi:MAG: T9SS type A sorting domain-containing protein [candidate division WOR-3 bacterium]|nr:MAG: T9SS type A sorting domain-containing protein [candidate division WOR-3 bacterium]